MFDFSSTQLRVCAAHEKRSPAEIPL